MMDSWQEVVNLSFWSALEWVIDSKQEEVTLASCPWGGVGDRQLAGGGELELLVQDEVGDRQQAGGGDFSFLSMGWSG